MVRQTTETVGSHVGTKPNDDASPLIVVEGGAPTGSSAPVWTPGPTQSQTVCGLRGRPFSNVQGRVARCHEAIVPLGVVEVRRAAAGGIREHVITTSTDDSHDDRAGSGAADHSVISAVAEIEAKFLRLRRREAAAVERRARSSESRSE